jgi:photosystem II stability/assembly factor-like uncharacterized protein
MSIPASWLAAGLLILATTTSFAQTPTAAGPKFKGIWEPINYTEDLQLTHVFFVTPEIGYVSGQSGTILKTTDAGSSWTPLLGGDPASEEAAIGPMFFVSPTVGWALQRANGGIRHLYRTTDGENWARIGEIPDHYEDMAFSSETEGVFLNDTEIWRTRNAGKTWSKADRCSAKLEIGGLTRQLECYLWKVQFVSPSVAYALGDAKDSSEAAMILKSEDGGASWSVVNLIEGERGHEGGMFFIDEQTGYLSTLYAKSGFRTTDGGHTWTGMTATGMGRRIIFADPEVGWAVQYDKLSYTTDGGRRWASRTLAFPAQMNDFSFPRRDVAYVVGDHGMIYRYRVIPDTAQVPARALAAPAMPTLDNTVLSQLTTLETRLEKIADSVGQDVVDGDAAASGSNGKGGADADWTDPAVQQQVAQLQTMVDAVSTGVPQFARKHRNLNMAIYGLKLLGDMTGQGSGLKQAFASLRQAKSAEDASAAFTSLHDQLDGMKTSVDDFQTSKTSGVR